MKKIDKYKSLFPLKAAVTKEIIKNANIRSSENCIGALTLKSALGENIDLLDNESIWGTTFGVQEIEKEKVYVTTKKGVNFMDIKKPRMVTFILMEY